MKIIEVKDFISFVAVKSDKVNTLLAKVKGEKIKGKISGCEISVYYEL